MSEHPLEKHVEKLAKHHAHIRAHHHDLAERHAAQRDHDQLETSAPDPARLAGADTEGSDHGQG